ncbi:DNA polymerase IV [Acholeplasma hippikon]|nr:DNA polymerase IV [Acholeplasma hippikon]
MQKGIKIIFHIDMNAFYASCAMIKEPYLKNKVFAIGGPTSSAKGVLSTASYKARKLGIHAAMSMAEALKIYPRLTVVPVDFPFYRQKSEEFIDLLKTYSPLIQQASIDEAYIDVTERSKEIHPLKLAKEIQTRIYNELKLPCSIGIAPTLFLAKMASDLKKPMGISVIRKRDVEKILYPMDIKDLFGIGKQTAPRLKNLGIETIGDFMNVNNFDKIMKIMKPKTYEGYRDEVLGKGNDIVDPDKYKIPKSISSESTFNYDVSESKIILDELNVQLEEAHRRLKKHQMKAKTVGFKLKKSDFSIITRSTTLKEHTNDLVVLKDALETLFYDIYENEKLRLVGATLSNLITENDVKMPFDLFTYDKFE